MRDQGPRNPPLEIPGSSVQNVIQKVWLPERPIWIASDPVPNDPPLATTVCEGVKELELL
jgi:hypothetical protein